MGHLYLQPFTLPKQSKYLDPSYKMGLDFRNCFGRKKLHLITEEIRYILTLLYSERLKLYTNLAFLSAVGLNAGSESFYAKYLAKEMLSLSKKGYSGQVHIIKILSMGADRSEQRSILSTFKNASFLSFHFCVMDNIWTKSSMLIYVRLLYLHVSA